MTPPIRNVYVYTLGQPRPASYVMGARQATLGLSCGHTLDVTVYPTTMGSYKEPTRWSCSECPAVPDDRIRDYLEGQPIPARVVK